MGNPGPVDRRKQYVRIADEMRRDIASGRYPVGESLPSIAELAERFNVAKMTVSNAIGALRDDGLIQTRQGSPSIVVAMPGEAGDEGPQHSEEFQLITGQLQEMRAAIRKLSSRLDDLDERTKGQDS